MKITHCKLNHLTNPLGYALPQLSFSWQVEDARGTKQTAARLILAADADLTEILYRNHTAHPLLLGRDRAHRRRRRSDKRRESV